MTDGVITFSLAVRQWNECNGGGEKVIDVPTDPVTMRLGLWASSYFKATLSNVPPGYTVVNGDYLNWCCDEENEIGTGVDHIVTLYCSYDPNMPPYFESDNWDMVNYILNHKQGDKSEVQAAIWYFIDGGYTGSDPEVLVMINDALANGEDFVPGSGQWIAVICDAGPDIQHTFIEVDP